MTTKYYTVEEVADLLQVSAKTIRRRIADGKISVFRDGRKFLRISEDALNEYLKSKEAAAIKLPPAPKGKGPKTQVHARRLTRKKAS